MNRVSSVSAETLGYDKACQALGLQGFHPRALWGLSGDDVDRAVVLKPWQVTGIKWMADQEASPLMGGILADACGLGKTVTTLGAIAYRINRIIKYRRLSTLFLLTLILVPSAIVDI